MKRKVVKEQDPKKVAKRKKILLIAGVAGACVGGFCGLKSLMTISYGKGVLDSKTLLENFNYEKVKHDIKKADYDDTFNQIFGANAKITITENKTGRKVYYVGENQKLDFIKSLLEKQPELKENVRLMVNAQPGDVVKNF
ncbi:MAG: hypothetical protein IKT62_03795 [Firmicutes bacterium]|nr:hypothetical protein [Bacillota bacterium]